jgi:diguanylate cyclase (GGDEF)-like protein
MLAPLIGSALLAAETHGSATQLADVDPLSGLSNRRRLTADLEAGAEAPLAAIMIDVDHFKHFNDTNGHAAGDEALRRVASLLADNVRPGDVVYRYGGEEFCVLLPGTSLEDAVVVAERVRTAVEAADIPGGQRQPAGRVTVSVGVARCEPGGHDRVIDDADAALYRAKHGGRNRVCGPA